MTIPPASGRLERSLVSTLPAKVGTVARVCGWAELDGQPGGARALVLRDHSGRVRLDDPPGRPDGPVAAVLTGLVAESALEVVGEVTAGGAEVAVEDLRLVGPALAEVPITGESPLEQRLDWRFLDLRRDRVRLVFEIQTTLERAMRELWHREGFIELHSPKIRPTPNKSGSELFTIEYFGGRAYLAQSPQFYKQMSMAAGFDRIFEIGPVFRANPLVTSRHDTEFTSVDVEISWIESHHDVMTFEERLLAHAITRVVEQHGDDITRTFGTEVRIPALPFPRVAMDEAYDILNTLGWANARPGDIDPEGERLLADHIARERGHEFVFVTDYGAPIRPFYHMRSVPGATTTRSFDLLWKGLEVTTGAQREHRYGVLSDQASERGIALSGIQSYLDFFKFGCPPHGGFGLGLTRVLMCLLGHSDVREVTYLHRGPNRLTP
ncbi:aspartate--tRNA(Asn) ligase [soil metagenome]